MSSCDNFNVTCKHCASNKFRIEDNVQEILDDFDNQLVDKHIIWSKSERENLNIGQNIPFASKCCCSLCEFTKIFEQFKKDLLNRKVIIKCNNGDCDCSGVMNK